MSATPLRSRRLAIAGIVGPVMWWVLVAVNGAITPGYSHVGDLISTLGAVGAPYAAIQTTNFAVFGSSILGLSLGIHDWFGDGRRPRVGTVLLGTFGVGVILAGVFPANPVAPDSTTALLHDVTSTVAFVTGVAGVGLVSRRTGGDDRWPSYRYEPIVTLVVVVVAFAGFMVSVVGDSAVVGVTQRVFIGVLTLWLVMQSYRLYRLSEASEPRGTDESRTPSAEG